MLINILFCREFKFDHLHYPARIGDSMHIHSYSLRNHKGVFRIRVKLTDIYNTIKMINRK